MVTRFEEHSAYDSEIYECAAMQGITVAGISEVQTNIEVKTEFISKQTKVLGVTRSRY